MIGAKKTAVILRNATPLYSAYADENSLAALVVISTFGIGPIPVRIMLDMYRLSTKSSPQKWPYPKIPMPSEKAINNAAKPV